LPPVAAVADPAAAKLPPPAAATKRVEVVTAAKAARRPEPSSEARDMLTMIKFPLAPIRNKQLRTKDPREHVGWRFLAWMAAYGLQGSYPHEKIDSLYFEFAQADHREPWGSRIVKAELESLRFVTKSTPEGKVHWNITPPSIAKLVEIMEKTPKQNPVINPTPKTDDTDVADGNVVPLGRRPA
jgi:hypothetical protein